MTPQKKKIISAAFPELAFALQEDAKPDPSLQKMSAFLEQMKGEKGDPGDDGYTPIKGKDYWTDAELNQIVTYILNKATPIKGKDYVDGTDGTDADEKKIIKSVLSQIEIPQPKDGKSVDFDEVVKQVLKLMPQSKVDFKPLHKKIEDGMALIDGRIKLIDQRWGSHGGGLSKVSTDSTLTGSGTPSSPLSVVSSGSGFTLLAATGNVDSTNVTFTFTSKPVYIVSDGAWYRENHNWTWSGSTATLTVPPSDDLWGFK